MYPQGAQISIFVDVNIDKGKRIRKNKNKSQLIHMAVENVTVKSETLNLFHIAFQTNINDGIGCLTWQWILKIVF